MKRSLSPSTNPAGLLSAVAAIYAAAVMIYNWSHHTGVIDPQVVIAGIAAAAVLYTRFLVTPVKDPRDGNGDPLVTGLTYHPVQSAVPTPAPETPPAPPSSPSP